MAGSLEQFIPLLTARKIKKHIQLGRDILSCLRTPSSALLDCDIVFFIDSISPWLSNSNFKVAQNGIEIMTILAEEMKEKFKPYISKIIPATIDCLGDSKDQVRLRAKSLMLKLMSPVSTPQYVFNKLTLAFNHKNFRVREEVMVLLQQTLDLFGSSSLKISRLMPSLVKLLGDPNSQVENTAISMFVHVYKHVGEWLRQDLAKRPDIPPSKLQLLFKKIDEVKTASALLPFAMERSVAETDRDSDIKLECHACSVGFEDEDSFGGHICKMKVESVSKVPVKYAGLDDTRKSEVDRNNEAMPEVEYKQELSTSKKRRSINSLVIMLELGHHAIEKAKPTPDGHTHDWEVFVRGADGSLIEHFVEKVVFYLHESYPRPRRVVKEPPYQVAESGYGSFIMQIYVYFRTHEEQKQVNFNYDLFLYIGKPVSNLRVEKLTFQNPSDDLRKKLLSAGGAKRRSVKLDENDETESVLGLSNSDDCSNDSEEIFNKEVKQYDLHIGDRVKVKYGHGRLQKVFEAKILKMELDGTEKRFYVHYAGWNKSYDEWIKKNCIVAIINSKKQKPVGPVKIQSSHAQDHEVSRISEIGATIAQEEARGREASKYDSSMKIIEEIKLLHNQEILIKQSITDEVTKHTARLLELDKELNMIADSRYRRLLELHQNMINI